MKRNVLLNPGPATTTDTVKYAQVVPDICPREIEFQNIMKDMRRELVNIVHGKNDDYVAVLFCGSGTINIDVCVNSLIPEGKKILIVNNGSYSSRAIEVCKAYGIDYIELKYAFDQRPVLEDIDRCLKINSDIEVVYTTHNETGTGILNPIREIGECAHLNGKIFVVDTTSTYAMRPIDVYKDNIDFCMASAQKGLMSMTGLSFIIGKRALIDKTAKYKMRSYYCNLFLQYDYFERTGQMRFTPPVQTIYATKKAIEEYFEEGEDRKWERHLRVCERIRSGMLELGFEEVIKPEWQSGLVTAWKYPIDSKWDFDKVHDYCYANGYTIYPGKIDSLDTFRLCSLGVIDVEDIDNFLKIFKEAILNLQMRIPVKYK